MVGYIHTVNQPQTQILNNIVSAYEVKVFASEFSIVV